jgi:hypothetical protein
VSNFGWWVFGMITGLVVGWCVHRDRQWLRAQSKKDQEAVAHHAVWNRKWLDREKR